MSLTERVGFQCAAVFDRPAQSFAQIRDLFEPGWHSRCRCRSIPADDRQRPKTQTAEEPTGPGEVYRLQAEESRALQPQHRQVSCDLAPRKYAC